MSNNLPQKYKENIFKKFFKYIKNLFLFKKTEPKENIILFNKVSSDKTENSKTSFYDSLRIESATLNDNEKNINLKDNFQVLENYSNEKLEKILQYYLDENEKKRALLKKLSA